MTDEPVFYLTLDQWRQMVGAVRSNSRLLDDGAELEAVDISDSIPPAAAITFYATRDNLPAGWPYPVLENDEHGHARTYIGDAQRDTDGRILLQVWLKEAVEQLLADYHGGATDLDETALDTRVGEVAAGRDQDRQWLRGEFRKLLATCEINPASSPS